MEVTEWQTAELFCKLKIILEQKHNKYTFFASQQCTDTAAAMGAHLVRRYITETDTEPDPAKKFEFDPLYGFPERKERGSSTRYEPLNSIVHFYLNWFINCYDGYRDILARVTVGWVVCRLMADVR